MGILFGILIFILQNFIMHPLISAIVPQTTGKEIEISTFFSSLWYLPVLIVLSVLKGGLSEELWRVFLLTRFRQTGAHYRSHCGIDTVRLWTSLPGDCKRNFHFDCRISLCPGLSEERIRMGSCCRSCNIRYCSYHSRIYSLLRKIIKFISQGEKNYGTL
jgi:hypothetical protein